MRLTILGLLAFATPLSAAEPFELKDGDKVVWLGSTLIEREQRYGYWETALTARWPDRKITFRNLGWSGDNVFGGARLAFDITKPELGLKRMVDLTLAEKPRVIFICYGTNESFEGEAGLGKFEKGLEKLLDELKPAKARIVLMTPTPFIKCGRALPDPTEANQRLRRYCAVVRNVATARQLLVADLYRTAAALATPAGDDPTPVTVNGVNLTQHGYYRSTRLLGNALGVNLSDPAPEELRKAVIAKNQLYFYRWRPQNETYLFGFRKHEQGKNAKEVAEFDPLVAKAEEKIQELKKPKAHRDEIVPAEKK